jgi:hypothetical protein
MALNLLAWARKTLRKIYGPKCEQGMWRIRGNLGLKNECNSADSVTKIKIRNWNGSGTSLERKMHVYPK